MGSTVEYRGRAIDHGVGRPWWWRARQPLVPASLAGFRLLGSITSGARPPADFLVVGAKRGGSTSLYRNLVATPGVAPLFPARHEIKGTYYFDVEFRRGPRWYRSFFPTRAVRRAHCDLDGAPALAGEASPYYLSHPHAATRAAETVPGARIIALLRDPVRRAWSHYQERVRQQIETLPTFAQAVTAEPDRLAGEWDRMVEDPTYVSSAHLNHGYLAQSNYDIGLARWLDAYPRDRVLILRSEDFYADERGTLAEVRRFLGLAEMDLPEARRFNVTGADDLDPVLADELRARLTPSVRRLESLVGRSFGWW